MKILIERAVIAQVLEALGGYDSDFNIKHYDLITALREALAEQADQEPVAYLCPSFVDNYATGRYETCEQKDYGAFPVYAAPVRTKDLTDDEIANAMELPLDDITCVELEDARAVIAADREKNKCK